MEPGFGSKKVDLSEYSSGSSLGEKITGAFADRPENTLAGSVLGMAHDLISSPQSQQEKVERAAKHDLAAHFVADTVAIVPQLKVTTAGLTRAALLIDPHKGASDNALNFGKNFAEGAVLNGVGKLAGASGQRLTQAYLGRGLLAESATHLSVGFGFGAVKSGFDEKSWHNSKGEFSIGSGAASILKGGTIGAAFNLPAGYIGLRAAKGTVALLGENASMRASNVVAGTVSGYAGGAVFGGIDSVMHGKSLSETMENIHMAGTAGALTGGFISGFDHSKNTQGIYKYFSTEPTGSIAGSRRASTIELTGVDGTKTLVRKVNFASMEENGSFGVRSDTHRKPRFEEREDLFHRLEKPKVDPDQPEIVKPQSFKDRNSIELSEVLDYQPAVIANPADYAGRLRRPRTETVQMTHLDPAYKGKIRDYADFAANSVVKDHKMRVWDIEGHTAVLKVEESYAKRQDAVMKDIVELQRKADESIPFDDLSSTVRFEISDKWKSSSDRVGLLENYMSRHEAKRAVEVIEARIKVTTGEYQKVILPHEFIAVLDSLPDRSLVKSVTILNEHDPLNPYSRVKLDNPNFIAAASADPSGNITFYLPPEKFLSRTTLRDHMNHEWTHLLDFKSPLEHDLFALAAFVDADVPPDITNGLERTLSRGLKPVDSEVAGSEKESIAGKSRGKKITDDSGNGEEAGSTRMVERPGDTKPGVDPDRQKEGKFYISEYSQKNRFENWAVHLGDEAMATSGDSLVYLGDEMPVRTAILMRALGKSISEATVKNSGTYNSVFENRVAYSNEVIVPNAVEVLVNRIKTGTPAEKAAAAELLGHLGDKDTHTSILRRLAIDPESSVLPEGVPEATHRPYKGLGGPDAPKEGTPNERRTISDIAFDSALRLREKNPEEQIDFLIEQGRPESPTQDLALVRLEDLPSERGYAYVKFLRLAGDPKNTPELIRMMPDMPDRKGARLVFEEALRLGEGGEGSEAYKRSLIMKALEIPTLRSRALDMVKPYLAPDMVSTLGRISKQQWDKESASKAKLMLETIKADSTVDTATMMMNSSIPANVEAGVQQASKVRDHRLIDPLLRVYVSGPESAKAAAATALQQYQPQMVKFYLRNMTREGIDVNGSLISKLYSGVKVPFYARAVNE